MTRVDEKSHTMDLSFAKVVPYAEPEETRAAMEAGPKAGRVGQGRGGGVGGCWGQLPERRRRRRRLYPYRSNKVI